MFYPINYGYVTGVKGGDGAEQGVYLLGESSAITEYIGKVIAVYHRYDDNETKWIVVLRRNSYAQKRQRNHFNGRNHKYFADNPTLPKLKQLYHVADRATNLALN